MGDQEDAMYDSSLYNKLDYTISALQNFYDFNAYKKMYNQQMARYMRDYNERLNFYYNQLKAVNAANNEYEDMYYYDAYYDDDDDDSSEDNNEKETKEESDAIDTEKLENKITKDAKKKVEAEVVKKDTSKKVKEMEAQVKKDKADDEKQKKEDEESKEEQVTGGKSNRLLLPPVTC